MSDIIVQIEGVGELRFPEGTSMDVIQAKVKELTAISPSQSRASFGEELGKNMLANVEMAGTVLSSGVADPLAKIVDIASTPFVGVEQGTQYGQNVREAMTYQPRTQRGQEFAQATGEFLQPVGEMFTSMGQSIKGGVQTVTGSEMAGEMTKDVLSFLPDLLAGYFLVKGLKPVRLKNPDGTPTAELNTVLADAGLSANELSPSTMAALPEVYNPILDQSPKALALRKEIEAGTGQAGTAKFQPSGRSSIKTDPLGKSAVGAGWDEGIVAMIKSATPETRALMLKQLDLYRAYKANPRSSARPWQPAGQAIADRLDFLQQQMSAANTAKNKIAREDFAGLRVDTMPVANQITDMFRDMGVTFTRGPDGKIKGNFRDSDVEFSPNAQRQLETAADLITRQPPPDAARLHRMKLQIDELISAEKLEKGGLSASGERILTTLRSGINDALRQASPEYARLNDFLHESIDILDQIQKGVGTNVKLSGPNAARDIGRQSRRIVTNTIAQGYLEDGATALQRLTDDLSGGAFNTNLRDLVILAGNMEKRFGTTAPQSLLGVTEPIRGAAVDLATGNKVGLGARAFRAIKDKATGVNESQALGVLEQLIRRNMGQ